MIFHSEFLNILSNLNQISTVITYYLSSNDNELGTYKVSAGFNRSTLVSA